MPKKYWQTPKFKELQDEWYARLKKAGFEDAELTIGNRQCLKQFARNCYRQANDIERENKRRYFELLSSQFQKETFSDKVERLVLMRRTEGVKIKQISVELKAMNERCHRKTIRLIIRKYERKWGIR